MGPPVAFESARVSWKSCGLKQKGAGERRRPAGSLGLTVIPGTTTVLSSQSRSGFPPQARSASARWETNATSVSSWKSLRQLQVTEMQLCPSLESLSRGSGPWDPIIPRSQHPHRLCTNRHNSLSQNHKPCQKEMPRRVPAVGAPKSPSPSPGYMPP